jgi:hypothetical protein
VSFNARMAERERLLAMPNDLALGPVTAVAATDVASPPSTLLPQQAQAVQTGAGVQTLGPNPSITLDDSLGLVVIHIRDSSGASISIPSQQLLQAYQLHELTVPNTLPIASETVGSSEMPDPGNEIGKSVQPDPVQQDNPEAGAMNTSNP